VLSCTISEILPSTGPMFLYLDIPMEGFPCKILHGDQRMARVRVRNIAENFCQLRMVHERYRETIDGFTYNKKL